MDATPSADPKHAAAQFQELTERLAPKLEELQAQLGATNDKVKRFIRQNPGTCLLGAAALGFVIGKWATRR
jgi:ElaB/YqjD/DUF883 family membrane-anchored ribosome-binding protein